MKRSGFILLLLVISLLCSGCILEPAENLYAIPEQSADYYELQSAINAAMPQGASYCAPIAGENQQPVQMADLDGDSEDEAIVFLKNENEQPLSICVFDKQNGKYELAARVDSPGTAFDHVQYVQFDGNAGQEILVGRSLSQQVAQTLSVYTLEQDALKELINTNYSYFITSDLDTDGQSDIVVLRAEGDATNGIAECYHWANGMPVREREVRMSTPAASVKRIITGKLSEELPAVFVASEYAQEGIVTDIFALYHGAFTNFALSSETDTGVKTLRDYYVYSCDIDNDGLIEIPRLVPLQSLPNVESSRNRSLILWYNLAPDGAEKEKELTYHNYADGWYLEIPVAWAQELTVTCEAVASGVNGYRFRLGQNGELFDIVSSFGEQARQILTGSGFSVLAEKTDTLYAYRIGDSENAPTPEELTAMFHLIRVEWKTGETS